MERRPDGYHNLETVFYPVPIKDVLEVFPMDEKFPSSVDCDLKVSNIQIEGDDAVTWHFENCPSSAVPAIDTHGDHRIAMAMALAVTRHQGLIIREVDVVSKSYPSFWRHLRAAGFTIDEVN